MSDFAVIFVRFDVVGFHRWEKAPAHRAYLRDRHRHRFVFEVRTTVDHEDREIEFHDLIAVSKELSLSSHLPLATDGQDFGGWSCEAIAVALADRLMKRYSRTFWVTVSEDGECGAQAVAMWDAG